MSKKSLLLASATLAFAALASGETVVAQGTGVQAVAPIQGYSCMQLARDAAHLTDASAVPLMLSAPSPDAASLGVAPYVVIARTPERVVNGYAETLWLGSTRDHPVTGWVSAGVLLPFHSAAAPTSHCTPTWIGVRRRQREQRGAAVDCGPERLAFRFGPAPQDAEEVRLPCRQNARQDVHGAADQPIERRAHDHAEQERAEQIDVPGFHRHPPAHGRAGARQEEGFMTQGHGGLYPPTAPAPPPIMLTR